MMSFWIVDMMRSFWIVVMVGNYAAEFYRELKTERKNNMKIGKYFARIQHGKKIFSLIVQPATSKRSAISMIMKAEGCPENAIIEIRKLKKGE